MLRQRTRHAGFTLVELLVVVSILGLLATLVVINFAGASDTANVNAARTELSAIAGAITVYKSVERKAPKSIAVLYEPSKAYSNQAYLTAKGDRAPGTDPWGNPYVLEKRKGKLIVICLGADGQKGGEGVDADLRSEQ